MEKQTSKIYTPVLHFGEYFTEPGSGKQSWYLFNKSQSTSCSFRSVASLFAGHTQLTQKTWNPCLQSVTVSLKILD